MNQIDNQTFTVLAWLVTFVATAWVVFAMFFTCSVRGRISAFTNGAYWGEIPCSYDEAKKLYNIFHGNFLTTIIFLVPIVGMVVVDIYLTRSLKKYGVVMEAVSY
jgi:hypothetical protein